MGGDRARLAWLPYLGLLTLVACQNDVRSELERVGCLIPLERSRCAPAGLDWKRCRLYASPDDQRALPMGQGWAPVEGEAMGAAGPCAAGQVPLGLSLPTLPDRSPLLLCEVDPGSCPRPAGPSTPEVPGSPGSVYGCERVPGGLSVELGPGSTAASLVSNGRFVAATWGASPTEGAGAAVPERLELSWALLDAYLFPVRGGVQSGALGLSECPEIEATGPLGGVSVWSPPSLDGATVDLLAVGQCGGAASRKVQHVRFDATSAVVRQVCPDLSGAITGIDLRRDGAGSAFAALSLDCVSSDPLGASPCLASGPLAVPLDRMPEGCDLDTRPDAVPPASERILDLQARAVPLSGSDVPAEERLPIRSVVVAVHERDGEREIRARVDAAGEAPGAALLETAVLAGVTLGSGAADPGYLPGFDASPIPGGLRFQVSWADPASGVVAATFDVLRDALVRGQDVYVSPGQTAFLPAPADPELPPRRPSSDAQRVICYTAQTPDGLRAALVTEAGSPAVLPALSPFASTDGICAVNQGTVVYSTGGGVAVLDGFSQALPVRTAPAHPEVVDLQLASPTSDSRVRLLLVTTRSGAHFVHRFEVASRPGEPEVANVSTVLQLEPDTFLGRPRLHRDDGLRSAGVVGAPGVVLSGLARAGDRLLRWQLPSQPDAEPARLEVPLDWPARHAAMTSVAGLALVASGGGYAASTLLAAGREEPESAWLRSGAGPLRRLLGRAPRQVGPPALVLEDGSLGVAWGPSGQPGSELGLSLARLPGQLDRATRLDTFSHGADVLSVAAEPGRLLAYLRPGLFTALPMSASPEAAFSLPLPAEVSPGGLALTSLTPGVVGVSYCTTTATTVERQLLAVARDGQPLGAALPLGTQSDRVRRLERGPAAEVPACPAQSLIRHGDYLLSSSVREGVVRIDEIRCGEVIGAGGPVVPLVLDRPGVPGTVEP